MSYLLLVLHAMTAKDRNLLFNNTERRKWKGIEDRWLGGIYSKFLQIVEVIF